MPNSWTHHIVIASPLDIAVIANAIGRAIDPDVGGNKSFARLMCGVNPPPATHLVCDAPLLSGFAAQCQAMLSDPQMLHDACAQDYANRWPIFTPPTLAQCADFLERSQISIEQRGWLLNDVLADWSMTIAQPA